MDKSSFPDKPVLLVDDEEAWILSVRLLLLRKLGINNVLSCTDSRMVKEILISQPCSLILLDYSMPHRNAEQVLAEVKPTHPDIPVIVLTGQDHRDLTERCMLLGAFDHFIKTSETENILDAIRRALNL